jgi:hypothetical protein
MCEHGVTYPATAGLKCAICHKLLVPAGKAEQPKDDKPDLYGELLRTMNNRLVDVENATKVKELKVGGYSELALRITDSNKRIGELEAKIGSNKRLEDLHTRINAVAEAMASRLMDLERRVAELERGDTK